MFIGLVIAMIILLAYAWYTWPQTQQAAVSIASDTSNATSGAQVSSSSVATTTTTSSSSASTGSASPYPPPSLGEQLSTMQIGGKTLYIALAENPAQQELGLGNRASLGTDQGMLFIFPNDAEHMFWMKDMSFSIDMIWMSDDGTVIYIQPNVAPSTYPDAFGPNENSRYVLEVPANFAADYGIKVGDKATLP